MDQPLLLLYLPGPRCIPTTATSALLQKEEAPNPVFRQLGRESEWMNKEPSSHRLAPARQQIRLLLDKTFSPPPSSITDVSLNSLYPALISCSSLSGLRALNRGPSLFMTRFPPYR